MSRLPHQVYIAATKFNTAVSPLNESQTWFIHSGNLWCNSIPLRCWSSITLQVSHETKPFLGLFTLLGGVWRLVFSKRVLWFKILATISKLPLQLLILTSEILSYFLGKFYTVGVFRFMHWPAGRVNQVFSFVFSYFCLMMFPAHCELVKFSLVRQLTSVTFGNLLKLITSFSLQNHSWSKPIQKRISVGGSWDTLALTLVWSARPSSL